MATLCALQAIYYAWRLHKLSKDYGSTVVEIGGGLGRTAYYASLLGLKDFTAVDIPLGCASQAFFFGNVLGENAVCLSGEEREDGKVKIGCALPARADIVVNVDSLTEMGRETAERYVTFSRDNSKVLLSVNHEFNLFNVRDLINLGQFQKYRAPDWTRPGYVEEMFVF